MTVNHANPRRDARRPTMNVAARAMSPPHVSAMISRVRACVPVSMPLLTKIIKGNLSPLRLGSSFVSVSLGAASERGQGY